MSTHDAPRATRPWPAIARARAALDALDHLVGGLGTAVLAVAALLWLLVTAALFLVGVGVFITPTALRGVRIVANRERTRLSRWGRKILEPEQVPAQLRAAVRDSAVRRELCWVVCHASLGLFLGLSR
jgi:hypothetical protein